MATTEQSIQQYFAEAVAKIKSYGYRVVGQNDNDFHYAFITDGTNIGYFQYTRLEGFTFSTVHIGSRNAGSGFSCHKGRYNGLSLEDINEDWVKKSFLKIPLADFTKYASDVRKYKDFEEFMKSKAKFHTNYTEF